MIETRAIVVKTEKNQVWVESSQTSSCGQCSQQQHCSTQILDNFSQKQTFAIATELDLQTGDEVQISIAENQLLRAAIIMYLMPLCALFAGAGIAESLLPAHFSAAELIISSTALLSFLSSLQLIKPLQHRFLNPHHCQPVMVKKL
jgi:sigma-E factor negative regulatory protein RseC